MFMKYANIQSAPTNCGGLLHYEKGLKVWLGDCTWDIIQFNIGYAFSCAWNNKFPTTI